MDLQELLSAPAPINFNNGPKPLRHEEIEFPHVIDNSMLSTFKQCERKHYWSSLRKARPLEDSVHLVAGAAYAKGLEVTRKAFFDEELPFAVAINRGIRAAIAAYGNFEPFGRGSVKTVWRIVAAMEYHFTVWPIDGPLKPYRPNPNSPHAIEYSFAVPIDVTHPITGEPLIYAGKFDMLGFDEHSGAIGPTDDKTTMQLGDFWHSQWDMAAQMLGYGWACRENGIIPTAAFIRGVGLLKTRLSNADQYVMLAPWRLDDWYENTCHIVERAAQAYKRGFWAKDYANACSAYGGCSYKNLCMVQQPEPYVNVDFALNTWSPLESRD